MRALLISSLFVVSGCLVARPAVQAAPEADPAAEEKAFTAAYDVLDLENTPLETRVALFTPVRNQLLRGTRSYMNAADRAVDALHAAHEHEFQPARRLALAQLALSLPLDSRLREGWESVQKKAREAMEADRKNWDAVEAAAASDLAAGRIATAAARYADAPSWAPSEAAKLDREAHLLELIEKIRAPQVIKATLSTDGPLDDEHDKAIKRACSRHWSSSVFCAAPGDEAQVTVKFRVTTESFKDEVKEDVREAEYSAGTSMQPNPAIARLTRDVEGLEHDIAGVRKSISRSKCSRGSDCTRADRQRLERMQSRQAAMAAELRKAPATVRAERTASASYSVKVHTWRLGRTLTVKVQFKGQPEVETTRVLDTTRVTEDHDGAPIANVPGHHDPRPTAESMRPDLASVVAGAGNEAMRAAIAARNSARSKELLAETDPVKQTEMIFSYLALSPSLKDEVKWADTHVAGMKSYTSASALAAAAHRFVELKVPPKPRVAPPAAGSTVAVPAPAPGAAPAAAPAP